MFMGDQRWSSMIRFKAVVRAHLQSFKQIVTMVEAIALHHRTQKQAFVRMKSKRAVSRLIAPDTREKNRHPTFF